MPDLRYSAVLQYVYATPWAVTPEILAVIREVVALRLAGDRLTDEELQARIGERQTALKPGRATTRTGVAVLGLRGLITHRAESFENVSAPGTSTETFAQRFRGALEDERVGSIVVDVDSPGGAVGGVEELAAEIFAARGAKPVVAVANTLAASAAYWIATAADELVVAPSAEVGSIGVMAAHEDRSEMQAQRGIKTTIVSAGRFKAEGNPFMPLTEEARAALQERADRHFETFVKAVARGRGVKPSAVRNGFGQGRVVGARDAVDMGMADRIGTLDETVARLGRRRSAKRMVAVHPHTFTF